MAQTDFHLEPEDREQLTHVVKAFTTPEILRMRAHVLLLADEGKTAAEISRELNVAESCAPRWTKRYMNRKPGDQLSDIIRTKEKVGKRDIPEEARAWVCKIAGPKGHRSSIKKICERVRAESTAAGYPRLAKVSYCSIRNILLEGDSKA